MFDKYVAELDKFEELTHVKALLECEGINYKEKRMNGGIWIYVNELMQIKNPTKKQMKASYPEVRISKHSCDFGYYVKECGMIHENQSLEQVLKYVKYWCVF